MQIGVAAIAGFDSADFPFTEQPEQIPQAIIHERDFVGDENELQLIVPGV